MAIKINSTKDAAQHGIKCLIYGISGAGKTRLSATLPGNTIILSAEAGLLSLREFDIPSAVISTIDDLEEAYGYLTDNKDFDNVVLDSLSEIAEQVLENEKKTCKDGRMAYAQLGEKVIGLVKSFRDLPGKNVVCIAKVERAKDDMTGAMLYTPSFPGAKLAANLPYYFDEVWALRVEKDADGNPMRVIQTAADNQWTAKDRSGALDQYEDADLSAIFAKISPTKGAKK